MQGKDKGKTKEGKREFKAKTKVRLRLRQNEGKETRHDKIRQRQHNRKQDYHKARQS